MNPRLQFIAVSLLLLIALSGMIFAAVGTTRAYQQFQQEHQRIAAGDVDTISDWMTVPFIARVYHVPATCLSQSLDLTTPFLSKRASLRLIAIHAHEPVSSVIHRVQQIISNYRQSLTCPAMGATHAAEGSSYG